MFVHFYAKKEIFHFRHNVKSHKCIFFKKKVLRVSAQFIIVYTR